jgi:hypothetical protein
MELVLPCTQILVERLGTIKHLIHISVTAEVSHDDMSLSKAVAQLNIDSILVTGEVFHVDKSWLNDEALQNM